MLGTWLNRHADERVRLQDRQFKIEDQKLERQLAAKAAEAEEDKYWFERRLEFFQIQSKIMLACNADELATAICDFQAFLERTPVCQMKLKNIGFINRYLTTRGASSKARSFASMAYSFETLTKTFSPLVRIGSPQRLTSAPTATARVDAVCASESQVF